MAKFGKMSAIVSGLEATDENNDFRMSDHYGNKLKSANDNADQNLLDPVSIIWIWIVL